MLVATADNQQVAILDACNEEHPVVAETVIEMADEHLALFGGEMTAVMVLDFPVEQGDDIAAEGQVVGTHLIADAGSLKRSPALIDLVKVVAENGGVGHLAAGTIPLGHGEQSSATSVTGQPVHALRVHILQRCLSAKSFYRMVGHAVAENNQVFHQSSFSFVFWLYGLCMGLVWRACRVRYWLST